MNFYQVVYYMVDSNLDEKVVIGAMMVGKGSSTKFLPKDKISLSLSKETQTYIRMLQRTIEEMCYGNHRPSFDLKDLHFGPVKLVYQDVRMEAWVDSLLNGRSL